MQQKSQKKIPRIDLSNKSYKEIAAYLLVIKKLILKKQIKVKLKSA